MLWHVTSLVLSKIVLMFVEHSPILMEKTKQIYEQLEIRNPCEFSAGWLYKFKLLHGLKTRIEFFRDQENYRIQEKLKKNYYHH